jgi:general stress protein 26
MTSTERQMILSLLEQTKDMTIATIRPDGFPQATTVSFVSDGLKIYFGCGLKSQKAKNLSQNNKVSLTVNAPYESWSDIKGLSIGGVAELVADAAELKRVGALMLKKFPEISAFPGNVADENALFRVTPRVISLLDYTKGFGHTNLMTVKAA